MTKQEGHPPYNWRKNLDQLANYIRQHKKQLLIALICAVCLLLSAFNGPHYFFDDEHENLLAGQLIAHGQVVYRDFFSHHMPLQYFLAVPFYVLLGTNIVLIKMAFGLLLAVWLLGISRHIYTRYGFGAWVSFVGIISVSQLLMWTNMFLAETFVAYSALHLLVLFWCRRNVDFTWRTAITYAALAAIPLLSSSSFWALSLLGYGLAIVHGWQWLKRRSLGHWTSIAGLFALPYALFAAYLLATHSLSEFRLQAFDFNTLYYSSFVHEVGRSLPETLWMQANAVFGGLQSALLWSHVVVGNPMASIMVTLLLACLLLVYFSKAWLELSVLSALFVAAASVRQSLYFVFLSGRSGAVAAVVGLAILTLYLFEIRKRSTKSKPEILLAFAIVVFFSVVSFASLAVTTEAYRKDNSTELNRTDTSQGPVKPYVVINAVSGLQDYYWAGPLDFYSQLYVRGQNASLYRFYLPWHAACPDCKARLLNDLYTHQPKVVEWKYDISILGKPVSGYGQEMNDFLVQHYYQASDPRLKYFFFLSSDKTAIDQKLQVAGFLP